MTISDNRTGFEEAAQGRFDEADDSDAYRDLARVVLVVYGYRCCLTGERFAPVPGPIHPELDFVAFRKREHGGPLSINNFAPMVPLAARAFRAGQILIASDYTVIADHGVLDRSLAARLRPDGRLVLPEEPQFWPAREHLEYHRRSILEA
jgi:predicted restriction endonuclease